jgi:hypothetical protein
MKPATFVRRLRKAVASVLGAADEPALVLLADKSHEDFSNIDDTGVRFFDQYEGRAQVRRVRCA